MNRIALMIMRNIIQFPWGYGKLCYYAKHTDKYPEDVKFDHIRYVFEKAIKAGNVDLKVYGKENIPAENGYMMYANHQGLFDVLAMVVGSDRPWAAVLKKELYKIPFIKQMVDCTYSFPMDREDLKQSMQVMVNVTKEVKKGRNYMIFPEGTRSKKGNEMLEFHSGSFKCALKAQCTILPIALINSYKVFDQKGSKHVDVQIHYLEPIPYEEYKDMKTVELSKMVHDRIEAVVKANS